MGGGVWVEVWGIINNEGGFKYLKGK